MEKLSINTKFQSGKTYKYHDKQLDVFLKDTTEGPSIKNVGKKVAFYIKDTDDLTLDFGGAILLLHGKIQPFYIENCKNFTVKNVIVKYDRSPYTEGVITDVGDDYLQIKINDNDTYTVEDGMFIPYAPTWENRESNKYVHFILSIDANTRQGIGGTLYATGKTMEYDTAPPYTKGTLQFYATQKDGELFLKCKSNIYPMFNKGNRVVLAHEKRDNSNFCCFNCENVLLENYRIINGIGMGIFSIHTKNVTIDNLQFKYDELSSGFISNAADGIHSFNCSGDFIVKNSIIEGTIDDALNVHGTFYQFIKAEGNVMYLHNNCPDSANIEIFGVGDEINVYKGSTVELSEKYTITDTEIIDANNVKFTVDRPVGNHNESDVVEDVSARCNLYIQNCKMGKSGVSHLRIQNGGTAIIENCELEFAIWLTGDMSYWFESSPVENTIIRNCRFTTPNSQIGVIPEFFPTEKEPYYHKNISIENCEFVCDTPVIANYARSVKFTNNINSVGKNMKILLTNCGEYECDNSTVESKTEIKDKLNYN